MAGQAGRGRFVALEGVDGCGKSTQAKLLAENLGALLTREPGGTALGRGIRELVLHEAFPPVPEAEALLMIADRAQHVAEVIEPALASGRWVVSDRFLASTIAYQGYGRGLDPVKLAEMSSWAAHGLQPDLYVLVDVDRDVAMARMRDRKSDAIEAEPGAFHSAVARGFSEQAMADEQRWVVVDGGASVKVVAERVAKAVRSRLGEP